MAKKKQEEDWFTCGNCGATLPMSARVCRECGADEEHGFSLESHQGLGLNLPDEDEDEPQQTKKSRWKSVLTWVIAIILLSAFLLMYVI